MAQWFMINGKYSAGVLLGKADAVKMHLREEERNEMSEL
jgi:hypothetical protein